MFKINIKYVRQERKPSKTPHMIYPSFSNPRQIFQIGMQSQIISLPLDRKISFKMPWVYILRKRIYQICCIMVASACYLLNAVKFIS